jgi:Amt family ammonium transporter
MGFQDFAGSTIVHSVGGWAALTGALILGARTGKYSGGKVNPMPGSNIPLATLGTFILWLGWFGFNGASQLAMGSIWVTSPTYPASSPTPTWLLQAAWLQRSS